MVVTSIPVYNCYCRVLSVIYDVIIMSPHQALFASSSLSAPKVVCNQTSQTLSLDARTFTTFPPRPNFVPSPSPWGQRGLNFGWVGYLCVR